MYRFFTAVGVRLFLAATVVAWLGGCATNGRYVSVKNGCMVDAVVQQAVYRQKANLMSWYWSKILVVNWNKPDRRPNTHALCTFVYKDRLCAYDYFNGTREIPLKYRGNARAMANFLYDPNAVRQAWFAEDAPPMRMMAGGSKVPSRVASTAGYSSQSTPIVQASPGKPVPLSTSDRSVKSKPVTAPAPVKIVAQPKPAPKVAITVPQSPPQSAPPALRASVSDYGNAKIRAVDGTLYLQN